MPFSKTTEEHTEEYWTSQFETFLKPLIEENPNLEALAQPHRTYTGPMEREQEEARILLDALRDNLKKELLASLRSSNRANPLD